MAYGVLIQLWASGDEKEVRKSLLFFESNHFPHRFSDFDVKNNFLEKAKIVVAFAASDKETFNLAVPSVTKEAILDAINAVENLSKSVSGNY